MFHHHTTCRACGNKELVKVLDLGVQPLSNDFQPVNGECAGYAPLAVLFCRKCTLAQLSVVVRPEVMYANYSYVTSESRTMIKHFEQLRWDILNEASPDRNRVKLLEIGSNTGFFLDGMQLKDADVLGIEPAKNLSDIANARGVKTINALFDAPTAIDLQYSGYRADVIVARHVFAHIDDWKGFIHCLEKVSHKDTLVVIEVPWVVDMFNMNSWDQVYHEHLSYVSITAIHALLEGTEFYLSEVKHYEIHGGAIALFIKRRYENDIRAGIDWPLKADENLEHAWRELSARSGQMDTDLWGVVRKLNREGKKVCGFGASAKATVWLNAANLTNKEILFVCDNTEQKQGKLIPGTDIPVRAEQDLYFYEADYCINFAWNFSAEVMAKHKAFTDRGGKWVQVVPDVRVLE